MKPLTREHQAVFNFETTAIKNRPMTETDEEQDEVQGSTSHFVK